MADAAYVGPEDVEAMQNEPLPRTKALDDKARRDWALGFAGVTFVLGLFLVLEESMWILALFMLVQPTLAWPGVFRRNPRVAKLVCDLIECIPARLQIRMLVWTLLICTLQVFAYRSYRQFHEMLLKRPDGVEVEREAVLPSVSSARRLGKKDRSAAAAFAGRS